MFGTVAKYETIGRGIDDQFLQLEIASEGNAVQVESSAMRRVI